jgi:hypothetical protein
MWYSCWSVVNSGSGKRGLKHRCPEPFFLHYISILTAIPFLMAAATTGDGNIKTVPDGIA